MAFNFWRLLLPQGLYNRFRYRQQRLLIPIGYDPTGMTSIALARFPVNKLLITAWRAQDLWKNFFYTPFFGVQVYCVLNFGSPEPGV